MTAEAGGDRPPATAAAWRNPFAGVAAEGRLGAQLAFVLEIDRVKQVVRRNSTADGARDENDAEHQWHAALMALLLCEHAADPVDAVRAATMLLIHDLVEIDAGDTYLYDEGARDAAVERERAAAERIYGLLPADQRDWLRGLWEEFEAGATADARYARSIDRLHPLLLNAAGGGERWRSNGVDAGRVEDVVVSRVGVGSPVLAEAARAVLAKAVADGILAPSHRGA